MKITRSKLRRIIREEISRELIAEIDPHIASDAMVQRYADAETEEEFDQAQRHADDESRMMADVVENPLYLPTGMTWAVGTLGIALVDFAVDMAYAANHLRQGFAILDDVLICVASEKTTGSPPKAGECPTQEDIEIAHGKILEGSIELSVGALMWYGPLWLVKAAKYGWSNLAKSTWSTRGRSPTPEEIDLLKRARTEVLSDEAIAASAAAGAQRTELEATQNLLDDAIEGFRITGRPTIVHGPPGRQGGTTTTTKQGGSVVTSSTIKPHEVENFADGLPHRVTYRFSRPGKQGTQGSTEYEVMLARNGPDEPMDIDFGELVLIPPARSRRPGVADEKEFSYGLTGHRDVRGLLDDVVSAVEDFTLRYPNEKKFTFSGIPDSNTAWTGPMPTGVPGQEYFTKRDRTYHRVLKRRMERNSGFSDRISSIDYKNVMGMGGSEVQGSTLITLNELRRIIREELLSEQFAQGFGHEPGAEQYGSDTDPETEAGII